MRGWGRGCPDLALCLQICLVPNQHDGKIVSVLDSEDLREKLAHLIETADEARGVRSSQPLGPSPPQSPPLLSPLPVVNGKHQQEAVASTHVLLPHGSELLLACCVQDCRQGERGRRGDEALPPPPASCPREPSAPPPSPHPLSAVLTVQPGWDTIHSADLRIGVFDGGVVVRHKVGLVGQGEDTVTMVPAVPQER